MDFETSVEWKGGYPARLVSQNGSAVDYSAPVEFGGTKGTMTPEDAFVGAANMCFQIVFAGIAENLGIEVLGYSCRAVGKLETLDGVRSFSSVALFPEIHVAKGTDASKVNRALDATKSRCLITNSMNSTIAVSARILREEDG
jgi:organic hydroperoxide reductase OsmC/OhrA